MGLGVSDERGSTGSWIGAETWPCELGPEFGGEAVIALQSRAFHLLDAASG
jgi:hypothetical protein